MFEFVYELGEKEFVRAHQTHLRQSLLTGKNLFLLSIALAIGTVQARLFGGAEWAVGVFGALWLLVAAFVLFAYFTLPHRLYRRSIHGKVRAEADDSGIEVDFGEGGRTLYSWNEILRYRETQDFLILYPKQQVPILIPRRAAQDPAQWRSFRSFTERKIFGA